MPRFDISTSLSKKVDGDSEIPHARFTSDKKQLIKWYKKMYIINISTMIGECDPQKFKIYVLISSLTLIPFPNFQVHSDWGHACRHKNINSWMNWQFIRKKLLLWFLVSSQIKCVRIMVNVDDLVKQCSSWNICNIWCALSAWTVWHIDRAY